MPEGVRLAIFVAQVAPRSAPSRLPASRLMTWWAPAGRFLTCEMVSANAFRISVGMLRFVPSFRISQVAELLGVSDDTVRRWVSTGVLSVGLDASGRKVVDGEQVARFAQEQVHVRPGHTSARNRLTGIVTRVTTDGVMAQVEIAAGRFRLVSLMSREAVEELGLRAGVLATAVVKATTVIVEVEGDHG